VSAVRAADVCPAPPKVIVARPADIAPDDHRIHIDSDDAVLNIDLDAVLKGRVTVRQDERTLEAEEVTYDYITDRLNVKGRVNFLDPRLRVRSDAGSYGSIGGATFDQANFDIPDRNGRGYARDIALHPDGKVDLTQVRYTTCPVGNEDWQLQAGRLALDTKAQEGVAHNVIMRFKDVPVFYTPYISFPLGDERKSGVLFPSIGHSGNNGYELQVPYYLNLAPNYDLTLTPGVLSARGAQLAEDFRFLTYHSHGQIDATFLPADRKDDSDNRSYFRATDVTDIRRGLRFDADVADISDVNYFSDFAIGADQTSVTFLQRRADVLYYDDAWRIRAELQNYQTIDIAIPAYDRPASRVPRIEASGLYPILDSQFEFALESEAVNFLREAGPCNSSLVANAAVALQGTDPCASGVRVNLAPEIRWSNRGPGYFFEPAAGFDFTQYALTDVTQGAPSDPTRALPYARLDTGLIFERSAGSQAQRTQTLEPRLVYSYVPYRNQDDLPIFDSGLPDLNLTELFRTNRYVGLDRIGDANQVALALTSRLFDSNSGTQYLSATIGQIRYFSLPRVGLPSDVLSAESGLPLAQTAAAVPVNPLAIPGALMIRGQSFVPYPGQTYYSGLISPGLSATQQAAIAASEGLTGYHASDLVTEVELTAYKHVSVNLDYQWNPYTSHTDKAEAAVQYRLDPSRVINIGYRYQTDILKQVDASFAWPIAGRWNLVGREVYSLQNTQQPTAAQHQTLEEVAGVEYKSCCYRVQLVQRRYLANRPGATTSSGLDTSIALQLELTGLSSVGKRADTFLEQSIRGYSTRDPNAQNNP
jgi:LPS-assembly protein